MRSMSDLQRAVVGESIRPEIGMKDRNVFQY
jgi:hypothetical protein